MSLPPSFLRRYAEIRRRHGKDSAEARRAADLIADAGRSVSEFDARVWLEEIADGWPAPPPHLRSDRCIR